MASAIFRGLVMQGSSIVDLIEFHLGSSHCFHLTE